MKATHISNRLHVPQVRDGPKSGNHAHNHTTPHLTHWAAFQEAIAHHHINEAANEIIHSTPLVILNGPTSTGRNTIIRELVKTGHYHFIVSDTTRPPRYNDGVLETNGVEYFFRTEDDMLDEIRRGDFIEAEIIHEQRVSGQSIRELKRAHDEGKIALNEIEILGILATKQLKPDAVAICLLPPSFEEWLRRLNQRTTISPAELHRRMRTALKIFEVALNRETFICVVNDNMANAAKTIDEIGRLGVRHKDTEAAALELVQKLYDQTREYLTQYETIT